MRKNSPVAVIYGHPLTIAKFGPAGRYIYAGGKDGSIKVWDMKSENYESSPPFCSIQGNEIHSDEVLSIDMNNAGLILSGGKDGCVCIVSINSKKVFTKLNISTESIESVEFCKELNWFLVATITGEFRVYECDNVNARCQIQVGKGIVKALWVGFEIYICGIEGLLECYNGRTGEKIRKYSGGNDTFLDIDVKK